MDKKKYILIGVALIVIIGTYIFLKHTPGLDHMAPGGEMIWILGTHLI